jgi:hypothetical protein
MNDEDETLCKSECQVKQVSKARLGDECARQSRGFFVLSGYLTPQGSYLSISLNMLHALMGRRGACDDGNCTEKRGEEQELREKH